MGKEGRDERGWEGGGGLRGESERVLREGGERGRVERG